MWELSPTPALGVTDTSSLHLLVWELPESVTLNLLLVWQQPVAPAPLSLSPWWVLLPPAFSPKPLSSPAQGPALCTPRPRSSPLLRLAWLSRSWRLAFPYALVSCVGHAVMIVSMNGTKMIRGVVHQALSPSSHGYVLTSFWSDHHVVDPGGIHSDLSVGPGFRWMWLTSFGCSWCILLPANILRGGVLSVVFMYLAFFSRAKLQLP